MCIWLQRERIDCGKFVRHLADMHLPFQLLRHLPPDGLQVLAVRAPS